MLLVTIFAIGMLRISKITVQSYEKSLIIVSFIAIKSTFGRVFCDNSPF